MTIAEIKSRLSIEAVLSHYQLSADRNGMLRCPFHEDKKASMKVYRETNTVYCFAGSCAVNSLDVIDFIMQMDGSSKHEAILKAKSLVGQLPADKVPVPAPTVDDTTVDRTAVLEAVFAFFETSLRHNHSQAARSYLAERGLAADALRIGYHAGHFHHHMQGVDVEACVQIGLLKPWARGYRAWAGSCLIFPLLNEQGQIVSLYGRSIKAGAKGQHYYLKARQGLYPGYPAADTRRLILTESVIDAASLQALALAGYSVLALYGTNGLTKEHQQALKNWATSPPGGDREGLEVIFALDGDAAGRKATLEQAAVLRALCPQVTLSTLQLPEGEDINSLCVAHEDAAGLLKELLSERTALGEQEEEAEEETIQTVPPTAAPSPKTYRLYTEQTDLLRFESAAYHITILGGIRIEGLERLKVTLKLEHGSHHMRHTLDLYHLEQVEKLISRAAVRLNCSSKSLQEVLSQLTEALEDYRLTSLQRRQAPKEARQQLSAAQTKAAKTYLAAPDLMQRTMDDLGRAGIVGEQYNRLLMYLVMTSRKRDYPLHVLSLARSGMGKTHLQERLAACIPTEDKLEMTTLSDNAFYYFGRQELRHKLLLIEDLDGAQEVLYPLRELQSKRRLSKTVTLKDAKGRLLTHTLQVEGPICLAACTTKERLYEDNANRSFLLYLDSSAEQDERIMHYQRRLSAGRINHSDEQQMQCRFQHMQQLLRNIAVRNPYAEHLRLPDKVFKPRRSNAHYLAFIEVVTFYHQFQRKLHTDAVSRQTYIETTPEDIRWANRLLAPVLLHKSDELSGACRDFLEQLKTHLQQHEQTTFYSKDIRTALRLPYSTLKRYLLQLTRYDYLRITGGSKARGYEYEILDYGEYESLQQRIHHLLEQTLRQAEQKVSGSVAQRGSTTKMSHSGS